VEGEVDTLLIGNGLPPKFYDGARYRLMEWHLLKTLILISEKRWSEQPTGIHSDGWFPGGIHKPRREELTYYDQPREVLLKWAARYYPDWTILEWEASDVGEHAWRHIADQWCGVQIPISSGYHIDHYEYAIVPTTVWREVYRQCDPSNPELVGDLLNVRTRFDELGRRATVLEERGAFKEWKALAQKKPEPLPEPSIFDPDEDSDEGDLDDEGDDE
jgi:hypothetical protein